MSFFKEPKNDAIGQVFGQAYLDEFHPADVDNNGRLYRHQKAVVCKKFIDAQAGPTKIFLDAGAGQGPYTYLAAPKFKTVYCFEFDQKELASAQSNVGPKANVVFKQVDLTAIPLPDNSVDAGICSEVLEHIPKHLLAAKELYRVLKPGGHLLFSMPNNNSMFYRRVSRTPRIKNARAMGELPPSHPDWEALRHVSFSPGDIEKIVTSAGFTILGREGANIISLPGFLRKALLKSPWALKIFIRFQEALSRPLAKFGAYYFLELSKI